MLNGNHHLSLVRNSNSIASWTCYKSIFFGEREKEKVKKKGKKEKKRREGKRSFSFPPLFFFFFFFLFFLLSFPKKIDL